MKTIRIATRKSPLALAQTQAVMDKLCNYYPNLKIIPLPLTSHGDEDLKRSFHEFSQVGVFVKTLEKAVLQQEADCALHCLKDLPSPLAEGLIIPCYLPREEVKDVLICRDKSHLKKIATSSIRRQIFLSRHYPDWQMVEFRGNINTRIAKVMHEVDGVVLAQVGIERLKNYYQKLIKEGIHLGKEKIFLEHLSQLTVIPLTTDIILPAPGQGTLVLECREGDDELISLLGNLNHRPTARASQVERAVMEKVEGGCRVPLGVWARENSKQSILVEAALQQEGKLAFTLCEGEMGKEVELADRVSDQLLQKLTSQQN